MSIPGRSRGKCRSEWLSTSRAAGIPELRRALEQGVGHVAPPGTSHAAREEARRLTGYTARVTGAAVYVRGDDVRAQGGLTATVITPRARGHRGTIAIGVIFGTVAEA